MSNPAAARCACAMIFGCVRPEEFQPMSKTKTIELSEPIKDHRGTITKIVLREPRYSDFTDLGMPPTWVSLADGRRIFRKE